MSNITIRVPRELKSRMERYKHINWSEVAQLLRLHVSVTPLTEDLPIRAGQIAYDGDVTFYDAPPVALAEQKKTVRITADEETQHGRLRGKGYPVELL